MLLVSNFFDEELAQPDLEAVQDVAAVAAHVLAPGVELGPCVVAGVLADEDRVVAEAVVASGFLCDPAVGLALGLEEDVAVGRGDG